MFKNILSIAAAGALSLVAATGIAVAIEPKAADFDAASESNKTRLGPVGPEEPISVKVGASRLVAYYEPNEGSCSISAVVSQEADDSFGKATRLRVALRPGELLHVDGTGNDRVVLTCAPKAEAMIMLNKVEAEPWQATNVLY